MQEVSYCYTAFISPEVYNPSSLKGAGERTQDANLPPLEKTDFREYPSANASVFPIQSLPGPNFDCSGSI